MRPLAAQGIALIPAALLTGLSLLVATRGEVIDWLWVALLVAALISSLSVAWLAARRLGGLASTALGICAGELPAVAVFTAAGLVRADPGAHGDVTMPLPIVLAIAAGVVFPAALGGALSGVFLGRATDATRQETAQ